MDIGSNIHDLDGDFKTIFFWISSRDTGVNCDSLGISSIIFIKAFGCSKLPLILSIFSTKN